MRPWALRNAPRVARDVVVVDADEDDAAAAVLLASPLEHCASPLHGTHHDAQKFSTTGLPRSDASDELAGPVEPCAA